MISIQTTNNKPASNLNARRHIQRLIGAQTLIVSYYVEDWDNGMSPMVQTDTFNGAKAIYRQFRYADNPRCRMRPEDILTIRDLDDLKAYLIESMDVEGGRAETLPEYDARIAEQKRAKLERSAKDIALRHGCAVSSLEFISACESELERFRDYRDGMREDRLCIGYGVSYEQWREEYNASVGDSNDVYEILDWIASECPLLWAKHEENKLANKLKDSSYYDDERGL